MSNSQALPSSLPKGNRAIILNRLNDLDDLVNALWMMAAALDSDTCRNSTRRIVEVVEERLQEVIALCGDKELTE